MSVKSFIVNSRSSLFPSASSPVTCAYLPDSYSKYNKLVRHNDNINRLPAMARLNGRTNDQYAQLVDNVDHCSRFKSTARLYSGSFKDTLLKLHKARVCVIGLGGVGSWVVEALARSGVGHLTLIDMDDVCISNVNRQLMAQTSTTGQFKAVALKDRIADINPRAVVDVVIDFVRPDNVDQLLLMHRRESQSVQNDSSVTVSILAPADTARPLHTSYGSDSGGMHPEVHLKGKFDYVVDAADGVSDKAGKLKALNVPIRVLSH